MHPGAQEIIFVIEGSLTVEVDRRGTSVSKAGETSLGRREAFPWRC
jgi:hypothetical protein